jgi:predicted DNA-binding ribbon-helix-helix protein
MGDLIDCPDHLKNLKRSLRSGAVYVTINQSDGAVEGDCDMCHIFAGQDPRNYAYETRSVRLMGHATSVRLEAKFWIVVEEIARAQGLPLAKFLSQLYEEALEIHGEVGNFASLLRCCCINFLANDFDLERLKVEARKVA